MNTEIEIRPGVVAFKEKDLKAMRQYLDKENRLHFEKVLNA